jgi:hypothetical protein
MIEMQRAQLEFEVPWQSDKIGKISGDSCKISHIGLPKAIGQIHSVTTSINCPRFNKCTPCPEEQLPERTTPRHKPVPKM